MAFIYGLIDPRCGQVRYVGLTARTVELRRREHLCKSIHIPAGHLGRWLRKLRAEGLLQQIRAVSLEECPEQDAPQRERIWIARFREEGKRLVNATEGGEGVLGHRHSDETRAKIRTARAKQVFSEETRSLWSTQRQGNQYARGNRIVRTAEHQEKLTQQLRGREFTEDSRQRMALAAQGNQNRRGVTTPATVRAKLSASRRGLRWSVDPQTGKRVYRREICVD